MNNRNNVSVVNDKGKNNLESGSKKQDVSVNSIKSKNSNIRNESTNINEQIKNQKTIGGDKKESNLVQSEAAHSILLNNCSSRPVTSWNFTEDIEK